MNATRTAIARPIIFVFALLVNLSANSAVCAADITQQQLLKRLGTDTAPVVLDVRKPDEFASGHIPRAINIPHSELDKRLNELRGNMNNEVVVYCESGRRAAIAEGILKQAGFAKIMHLEGDMQAWRKHGLPQERSATKQHIDFKRTGFVVYTRFEGISAKPGCLWEERFSDAHYGSARHSRMRAA